MDAGNFEGAGLANAGLPLKRVARSKLAESVADQLLEQIRETGLPRGTKIPSERELMEQLGVGRSSVREAINGLAMMGVLEIRHGQGAFVLDSQAGTSPLTTALARGITKELFEARRVIEVETARLAALRRTDNDLQEIEETLREHEAALADGDLAVEPSVQFHVRVANASHNELLAGFVYSFIGLLGERGQKLEQIPGYREWELDQHRAVLVPIAAGDGPAAGEQMLEHLDAVAERHESLGLAASSSPS